MTSTNDACRAFASLALFRELYSEKKNDIYGIVAEFLKAIISTKGIHEFTLSKITRELNNEFDFRLPEIIVKPALRRITGLTLSDNTYTVNQNGRAFSTNIVEKQNELIEENNAIFDDLVSYVADAADKQLDDAEKGKVRNTFCSYLMEDTDHHEYNEFVSAFIVEKSRDSEYKRKLNAIREGIILNSGIRYTPQINELTSWETPLLVFLDTEILFHIGGLNGEVFQNISMDLLDLVNEINAISNKKNKGKMITLTYFPLNGKDISDYFGVAERVVDGEISYTLTATAMKNIINGCSSSHQVIEKKQAFLDMLRRKGISQYPEKDYYEDQEINIESQETVENLQKDQKLQYVTANEISDSLRLLNYINVIRKGKIYNYFEESRAVLLTGKNTTKNIALNDILRKNGAPLATTLNFIISRLWFKLNKGFGENATPKSFDILTKAQIVLSTQLNNSITKEYKKIQEQFKKGEMSKDVAVATIIELRNRCRNPEDVIPDELDEILTGITEKDIDNYQDEMLFYKEEAAKAKKEIELLRRNVDASNERIEQERINHDNQLKDEREKANQQIIDLQTAKTTTQKELKAIKKILDEEIIKRQQILDDQNRAREKIKLILSVIALIALVGLCIFFYVTKQEFLSLLSIIIGIIQFSVNLIISRLKKIKSSKNKPISLDSQLEIQQLTDSGASDQV